MPQDIQKQGGKGNVDSQKRMGENDTERSEDFSRENEGEGEMDEGEGRSGRQGQGQDLGEQGTKGSSSRKEPDVNQ